MVLEHTKTYKTLKTCKKMYLPNTLHAKVSMKSEKKFKNFNFFGDINILRQSFFNKLSREKKSGLKKNYVAVYY